MVVGGLVAMPLPSGPMLGVCSISHLLKNVDRDPCVFVVKRGHSIVERGES